MRNRETRLVALALAGVLSACGSNSRDFIQQATGGIAGQAGSGAEAGGGSSGSQDQTGGVAGDAAAGGETTSGGHLGSGGRHGDAGVADAGEAGDGTVAANGGSAGHAEAAGSAGRAPGTAGAEQGGSVGAPAGSGGLGEGGGSSCTDGARECASRTSARFCDHGTWVQELCPEVPSGYESTCTGDGVCGRVCASGTTECGGNCVELDTDPSHCGQCEHGCGGGACVAGSCQAMSIADGEDGAYSMTLSPDGNAVFWLTPAEAKRCPASGCSPDPVTIAEEPNSSTRPYVITATSTYVFWSSSSTELAVCPAAGCTYQTVTPSETGDSIRELAKSPDGSVYVLQRFYLLPCFVSSCEPAVDCVAGDSLRSVAMTDTGIFHLDTTDPWGLYVCKDNVRTRLADIRGGDVVRVHGEYAYVASTLGGVYRCHQDGCAGAAQELASGETSISGLAVDDTGVYWTLLGSDSAATGALRTVPHDGSEPARTVMGELSRPTSVQVSGGFVYWVEQGLIGVTGSGRVARIRI